jgi:hypothetical protein
MMMQRRPVEKPMCPGCSNMLTNPYEHHYTCDLSIDFIRRRQAALREPGVDDA